MTLKSCTQCLHYKPIFGGRCYRDIKLQSGQELRLHNTGRLAETERDDKAPAWKSIKRDMADVCGRAAKFWSEK